MKHFIFVCLVETENSTKLNLDSCKFKVVYFYNINTKTRLDIPIIKKFAVFIQENLPGLPPKKEIEHKIKFVRT